MSTTCMSDVRFFGFRRVLTHGNQPFWHMAGLKYSSWKWPRKYNRCFASQTFIPSLFDGMVYNFWGMFLWYLAVIDHEFLTRLLFFPKFSTQQWVKEEIGSWKKLHEDHHYHYIINGVYTLILFNFYVHFCKLLQHTQQNIYSIYYYTYTYTYVHLIIYSDGFSILGTKHFVGTTHEQHVYKKTLSLSKISSFGRFLLSTNGWSRWSRVPWVMGVWNLGVGAVGQNSVQGWVPGKISPGGKKEHMIQYTIPENSWISL